MCIVYLDCHPNRRPYQRMVCFLTKHMCDVLQEHPCCLDLGLWHDFSRDEGLRKQQSASKEVSDKSTIDRSTPYTSACHIKHIFLHYNISSNATSAFEFSSLEPFLPEVASRLKLTLFSIPCIGSSTSLLWRPVNARHDISGSGCRHVYCLFDDPPNDDPSLAPATGSLVSPWLCFEGLRGKRSERVLRKRYQVRRVREEEKALGVWLLGGRRCSKGMPV